MSSNKKRFNNNANNHNNNSKPNINNTNIKSQNNQTHDKNITSDKVDNSSNDKVESNHIHDEKQTSTDVNSKDITQIVRILLIQHNYNELKQTFKDSPTILGTKEMKRFQPVVIDLIRNLKSALDLNNKEITSKLGLSQTSIKRFTRIEFIDERIKVSTLNTLMQKVSDILDEHKNTLNQFDDNFMFTLDKIHKLK